MNTKELYEKYWQYDEEAAPEKDRTISERKALLTGMLEALTGRNSISQDNTGNTKGLRVFDAGCGLGEFTSLIHELGFNVTGMDISDTAIERANKSYPGIDFRSGSLEDHLPFRDEEFQVVWATEILEHIFDVHGLLSQFNRHLKPGGQLILTTPYHGIIKNIAIALFGFERHFNPDISHVRFFTNESLKRCLVRAGFKPVFWQGIGRVWPLYKSMFLVAKKVRPPEKTGEIIG